MNYYTNYLICIGVYVFKTYEIYRYLNKLLLIQILLIQILTDFEA